MKLTTLVETMYMSVEVKIAFNLINRGWNLTQVDSALKHMCQWARVYNIFFFKSVSPFCAV